MVDARRYHAATNHTPASIRSSTYTRAERNRPRPFKTYLDRPTVHLDGIRPPQMPALRAIAQSRATAHAADDTPVSTLDREALATLCYLAAGITQETTYNGEVVQFRAASCTGNLHHIDLYLVAGGLDDLEAGVYHFDPVSFSFDVLRRGDHRGTVTAATGDDLTADAPVWAVLTATWWRNAWKYQDRAYRHAFWDAGTVIANLLATAHGLGYRSSVTVGFVDDEISRLIGVTVADEAPIAMVPLGDQQPPPTPSPVEDIAPATAPLSPDPLEHPRIVDAYVQGQLASADAVRDWRGTDPPTESGIGHAETERIAPVDDGVASARPLLETVRRRGSKRAFTTPGPTTRQLATILDRSLRGIPGDWNDGRATGPDHLECYLLITGVRGLDDGRYRYLPERDALARLGDTSRETKERLALNQPWAGDAQVNVYLMADIETIVEHRGNRGYRLAQLEAGITLGRLYLATAAHRDLGGTGLTFFDAAVAEHLIDGDQSMLPMTMFALGRIDP